MMLHALIMAGGSGTRFWPASRVGYPKQLLALTEKRTMIQQTVDRLENLVPLERLQILTHHQLVNTVRQQLPQLPEQAILGEPCKRDTAPCIGLAALLAHREDPDATMLVLPADHVIHPTSTFCETIEHATGLVESQPDQLVTLGIAPTYAATSFGYIQRGPLLESWEPGLPAAYVAQEFCEKPGTQAAQEYLETGNYYWNSGIFIWKAQTILQALQEFEPTMFQHLEAIADQYGHDLFQATLTERFNQIDGKSIDYAVMEKYDGIVVLEAPFQWNDVGNWQSLATMTTPDAHGNVIMGKHMAIDSHNSIIRSDGDHLVVTVGLDNLIVVHTEDATLIMNKQDEEAIREVTRQLREQGWDQYL